MTEGSIVNRGGVNVLVRAVDGNRLAVEPLISRGDEMPDPHYPDHLTEQLRADIQRLEQQLADTRDRVAFAEARLADVLAEKQQLANQAARLSNELADAENRLARCRNGGAG